MGIDNLSSCLGEGKNSMMYGYGGVEGRVSTQEELLGNHILWSTTDFNYNSNVVGGGGNGNINTINDLLNRFGGSDKNSLDVNFNDEVQSTDLSNLYRNYGNFYSITYSLGLIDASSKKTQDFTLPFPKGAIDETEDFLWYYLQFSDVSNPGLKA